LEFVNFSIVLRFIVTNAIPQSNTGKIQDASF